MKGTTHRTARFAAALLAALVVAQTFAVPLALAITTKRPGASSTLRLPKASGYRMHWYRWHPSARVLQKREAKFGSTAVIGVESMRDLRFLRTVYGLAQVRAMSELHAVEVSIETWQLHGLLAKAPTDPRIRYVSPVGQISAQSMPNDPFVRDIDAWSNLPFEWQFAPAHVDRAFDFSQGDPQIKVGVIDTGVADVPDLAGKVDEFWTFAPDGTLTRDSITGGTDPFGHGTGVTSIIAANVDDHVGMAGFGGATHAIVVSACPDYFLCPETWIARALLKLDSLGVRIVNISLGGPTPNEPPVLDAIHKVAADGVLIVASAGNDTAGHVGWPAAYLQPSGGARGFGLAVGATDVQGKPAKFSNSGKHLSLVAPGTFLGDSAGVLVALPSFSRLDEMYPTFNSAGAHYGYIAGTSFAAPEVAGIAALVWAARPELKNYQVADIIKQSASRDPSAGWTPTMGCGLLDAGAALELATSRPASAWAAEDASEGTACSAEGNEPPSWPAESAQTITFEPLADKTFGDRDFPVSATVTSGLPVTFSASGNCSIDGVSVHLTGVGSCTITASQAGDEGYSPAAPVSHAFSIGAARTFSAVATSGHWGEFVKLPFRTGEGTGSFAVAITVQKNGAVVAQRARSFVPGAAGHVYAVTWRAPRAKTKGTYRFCVQLSAQAAVTGSPSCARIRLR